MIQKQDDDGVVETASAQQIRIVGHNIYCHNCPHELAQFYHPCGLFLCLLCFIHHRCLVTLRETYDEDLKKALT